MNSPKIDKFFTKALDKMFQAVGMEKWDKDFTDQKDWYLLKEWTEEDEGVYKDWFLKEIKKDLRLNKKQAEKEWAYFSLMYSWKYKKIESEIN